LKDKNIKLLLGKPLIGYTIESALKSRLIDKIVVSTDDKKIAGKVKRYGIQVIKRPKKYATDKAPIEQALRHAVKYLYDTERYLADIVVWLQANIPIRKKSQIDNAINKLIASNADSAVTVYPVSQFPQWMKRMNKKGFLFPLCPDIKAYRRQDLKEAYLLDGAIVAIKRTVLMTAVQKGVHTYMGKKIIGIIQDGKYTVEVDNRKSLDLARFFMSRRD